MAERTKRYSLSITEVFSMSRRACISIWLGIMGCTWQACPGASSVNGRLVSDGVTGRTAIGHGWIEENIYMNPLATGAGGADQTAPVPPGYYSIGGGFSQGDHLVFTLGFDRAPAFSYRRITVPDGTGAYEPIELKTPAHYSVAYNSSSDEWGSEPWIWGSNFYQTFVATSPHITRLATKLAGKSGDHAPMTLNFAVYGTNDGPPSSWPQISALRSYPVAGGVDPIIHIFWVAYRSDEMTLTVGEKYAVRMWVAPGSAAESCAIVARSDSGFSGYAGGHLYIADTPYTNLDGYFYVSGGAPGTVVNHCPVNNLQFQGLVGWSTRFGQTFRANGTGLAGVETAYTSGTASPTLHNMLFQVYDGVGGNPIGPARSVVGIPGFHQARIAVAWAEGEVPLVPGQMYYVEYTPPPVGCNTWSMSENVPGELYVNRVSQAPFDLAMAIAEYRQPGATISLSTSSITKAVAVSGSLAPDTFTLRNSGTGTVSYSIADNASWLSVAPESGSSTGEQDEITISYATETLNVGSYLAKITITSPEATNSPQTINLSLAVKPHPGDMDMDRDVDLEDFGRFQRCLTGSGIAQTDIACGRALLDEDTDVDLADTEIFISCLSGPGIAPTPGCTEE
jgi:hypothetical protein